MRKASESRERIGVLLVPGMGTGQSAQTLAVFAEALLAWLDRWSGTHYTTGLFEPLRRHVQVRQTHLDPINDEPPQTVLVIDRSAQRALEVIIAEAWWPACIRVPAAGVLGRWLVRVLPFLLLDVADTVVLRDVRRFARRPLNWWWIAIDIIELLLAAPLAMVLVAAVLLVLLLAGLHIPGIDRVGAWVQLRLARTFGDSHVLTTSPIQADAAVETVRRALDDLARRCDAVAVVAFAQGAAVAHQAARRGPQAKLRLFATVGSGLRKYHEIPAANDSNTRPWQALIGLLFSAYFLAGPALVLWAALANPSIGKLVLIVLFSVPHILLAAAFFSDQYGRTVTVDAKTYALPGAGKEFTWIDYYASGDIVANGPIVDSTSGPPTPGWPHEVQVHNRGSWFSDHKTYLANVEEFLGDLVPRLIGLGSDNAPQNTGQAAAAARRYWRVKWLVAARILVVATTIALLLRLYVHRAVIGARVIDLLPVPVSKLGALAAKPFADLPAPRLSPPVVGVLSIALAGWVTYAILQLTWRRWDRRDGKIFFSGKEYDAGGVPFGMFLAGLAVVAAAAVGAVLSVWFNADLLSMRCQAHRSRC